MKPHKYDTDTTCVEQKESDELDVQLNAQLDSELLRLLFHNVILYMKPHKHDADTTCVEHKNRMNKMSMDSNWTHNCMCLINN